VLAFIMYFVIPWIPNLAGKFEILFVNTFGLPFQSGTIFYFVLLIGLIVWGLGTPEGPNRPLINSIILSFAFLLIGYSTFLVLVIRANADTPSMKMTRRTSSVWFPISTANSTVPGLFLRAVL